MVVSSLTILGSPNFQVDLEFCGSISIQVACLYEYIITIWIWEVSIGDRIFKFHWSGDIGNKSQL